MQHFRKFKAGKAEFEVTFVELGFSMAQTLDDHTSELFFDPDQNRQGTNLRIGRIKEIVAWAAVKTQKNAQKNGTEKPVRFRHPDHENGSWVQINLGGGATFEPFPIINTDVEYMVELDRAFMRQIVDINPWLSERWPQLFGRFVRQEDEVEIDEADSEEEAQAKRNPTSSGGEGTSEKREPAVGVGTSTSEPS